MVCDCLLTLPNGHCRMGPSRTRRRRCRPLTGCMTACVNSHRVPFLMGDIATGKGKVRLVMPAMTWEDYVHLAFDEIRMAGAGSPQIARRLRAALEDLLTVAPPERKRPLQEQLDLLRSGIGGSMSEAVDRNNSSQAELKRTRLIRDEGCISVRFGIPSTESCRSEIGTTSPFARAPRRAGIHPPEPFDLASGNGGNGASRAVPPPSLMDR